MKPPALATGPWEAGQVTARARAIRAANPGWMTLDGTNSWLLAEPGASCAILIDPGPDDPAHRRAILAAADAVGVRITLILLTHGHADHSEGASALHEATRAPVLALDPRRRLGEEGLSHGDVLGTGGLELRVVGTPGHTRDSLTFVLPADAALLTGDTVLGRGTAVIAHPDGQLGAYLRSLDALAIEAEELGAQWILPGHGPALSDAPAVIDTYRSHRSDRLRAVTAALGRGLTDVEELLDAAYPEVPAALRPAARLSLLAQLEYLREVEGRGGPEPSGPRRHPHDDGP